MSLDDFESRVARYGSRFMYLRRQMTPDAAQRILDLRTPGVYPQREYGATTRLEGGSPNTRRHQRRRRRSGGQARLSALSGRSPGQRRVIKDRRGRLVRELGVIREAQPGGELTLAIDQRISTWHVANCALQWLNIKQMVVFWS